MICKNCGKEFQDNYCSWCGEKKFDTAQLSVKHFFGEIFEGLLHFDNKFFRTLKTLITRPGQLSLDYSNGVRIRYMRPIQLFVVINLLFFFLMIRNLYSLPLANYMEFKPFTNYNTKQIITGKLQKESLSLSEYQQLFDERMEANSKEFIFLYIPFYGAVFALLFFRSKKEFVEHMVFATHFVSFILVFLFVLQYAIMMPFYLIKRTDFSQASDNFFSILISAGLFIYLSFAIRRFYRSSILWALIVAGLVAYTYIGIIQYYRMFLFYKIVYLH